MSLLRTRTREESAPALLAATDKFIDELADLRVQLEAAQKGIVEYERTMREMRKALAETVREVS